MNAIIAKLKASKDAEDAAEASSTLYNKGKQPDVTVGIVSAQKIHFSLNKPYLAKGEKVLGEQVVEFSEGGVLWNGNQYSQAHLPSAECRRLVFAERRNHRCQLSLGAQRKPKPSWARSALW